MTTMGVLGTSFSFKLAFKAFCGVFILLMLIDVMPCSAKNNKYSEEANINSLENEENPFRMKKTNLIWDKARQRLHGQKLAEAYAELELHDKREAELKKLKADGKDEDGVMEEKVLKSYQRLMKTYSLDSPYKAKRGNDIGLADDDSEKTFNDEKLEGMWKRAKSVGFTGDDLEMLKQEFFHQQMKIDEHNYVHGKNGAYEGSDNDILGGKDPIEQMADKKKSNQDVRAGYLRLQEIVDNLPKSESDFKDHRVTTMWELAKKTNWTTKELDSFKEELSHLDHKLLKQAHYAEKVQDSLKKFNDPDSMPSKHKHIYDTANVINKRVDKIRGELKTRLDKALRHVEL